MLCPIFILRWDLWQPGLGVVDVTNPDARRWYEEKLEALLDLGVDTFKVAIKAITSCFFIVPVHALIIPNAPHHRPILESGSRMRTWSSTMDPTHCACITRSRSSTMRWSSGYWSEGSGRARPSCSRAPRRLVDKGTFRTFLS